MQQRNLTVLSPHLQADLINQLYQGKLKDYVRCLECGYESWRIDTYLDIPLVIRPFGASQAYGSVVCFSPFVLLSIYFITAALNIYSLFAVQCCLKATLNSVVGTVSNRLILNCHSKLI